MASGTFAVAVNGIALTANGYWSSTPNAGANSSTLTAYFTVTKSSGTTFGNGTWTIFIDGTPYSTSYNFTITGPSTKTVHTVTLGISHNSNGSRSVGISVSGGIPGTSWTTTSGSTTAVLEDFDRSPTWIDSSVNGTATRGTAYSDGVSANATSSYGIVSGRLPFGLSLNTSNGAITGTPTTVESQSFTIRAYGSFEGSIDTALSINVRPALPVFSDGSVDPSARVGIAYSDGVTASETASYSVFSGALPGGLSLNTSTGAITGTPTTPGTFTFVIRATNVTGSTNTGTLTITVISAARVWNGTAFVSGQARVWNGTAFVTGTIRVWDGSTWKNTN